MADKNIHEGDEVSWKWGTSEPTGTVAEVATEGKLEIETKGKLIHKNADPSNPAVHVERTGNDVVKRASELTKLSSSAEGNSAELSAHGKKDEALTIEEQRDAGDEKGSGRQESDEKVGPKKRATRKKSNAAAISGEKRTADETAGGTEAASAEATGKKTKKAKTTKADAGGEKKGPGRPRKDSKAKKAQDANKHADAEAMDVDASAKSVEDMAAPKMTGPGRPKKSDASDHPPVEHAPLDKAANTCSMD